MAKAILAEGIPVVTSRLAVEFKKPALVGERLRVEGRITGHKSRAFSPRASFLERAAGWWPKPAGFISGLKESWPPF